MPGMLELGEDIFLKPVRLGLPQYSGTLADMVRSPRNATAMGLLVEAQTQRQRGARIAQKAGGAGTMLARVRDWFAGNF
ncbi:cell division protein FtsA [mine drainage metagenome]|uniref:Cell division protein FtsA n=1 Tax=mine drainage metagenome TaxID=410659 RepID=A0A1J5QFJ8_9ZZZZ